MTRLTLIACDGLSTGLDGMDGLVLHLPETQQ